MIVYSSPHVVQTDGMGQVPDFRIQNDKMYKQRNKERSLTTRPLICGATWLCETERTKPWSAIRLHCANAVHLTDGSLGEPGGASPGFKRAAVDCPQTPESHVPLSCITEHPLSHPCAAYL